MKVQRLTEIEINNPNQIKIGDRIRINEDFTATCQKIGKKSAIFLFDRYLDDARPMNKKDTNTGGYEASDLRLYLLNLEDDDMFDGIRNCMKRFKNGDLLRIPTVEELLGSNYVCGRSYKSLSNKKQWALMSDRDSRSAYRPNSSIPELGWLQNIHFDSKNFCCVNAFGILKNMRSSSHLGVRIVFKIGLEEK